jgi:hypothetical protein
MIPWAFAFLLCCFLVILAHYLLLIHTVLLVPCGMLVGVYSLAPTSSAESANTDLPIRCYQRGPRFERKQNETAPLLPGFQSRCWATHFLQLGNSIPICRRSSHLWHNYGPRGDYKFFQRLQPIGDFIITGTRTSLTPGGGWETNVTNRFNSF